MRKGNEDNRALAGRHGFGKPWFSRGQTIGELAIFGTILLFVISLMVRSAVNFNYNQTQQLKAMRLAMDLSFQAGQDVSSARKMATVILIEDRQEVSTGKFYPQTRTPYMLSSSAAFTKNLMLTSDYGNFLPVIDIYINGDHFSLTTAAWKEVRVGILQDGGQPTSTNNETFAQWLSGGGILKWILRNVFFVSRLVAAVTNQCNTTRFDDTVVPCSPGLSLPEDEGKEGIGGTCPDDSPDYTHFWIDNCEQYGGESRGCVLFLHKTVNLPNATDPRFCLSATECPDPPSPPWNMPLEDRFNLDLSGHLVAPDGTLIDNFGDPSLPKCANADPSCHCDVKDLSCGGKVDISQFPWQWSYVQGNTLDINFKQDGIVEADVDLDGKEETIVCYADSYGNKTCASDEGDEKAVKKYCDRPGGTIWKFWVLDHQDGDWDASYTDWDRILDEAGVVDRPAPGFSSTQIMTVQTNVQGRRGTFTRIEEAGQQARHTQKSDRLDIVERVIQLSNDTGMLCRSDYDVDGDGSGPDVVCCCDPANGSNCPRSVIEGQDVQGNDITKVYYDCGANACKTQGPGAPIPDLAYRHCFDAGEKKLYIRSRISERRGTRWITDVSN